LTRNLQCTEKRVGLRGNEQSALSPQSTPLRSLAEAPPRFRGTALLEITLVKPRPRAARTLIVVFLAGAPLPLVSDPTVLTEALQQPNVERRAVCPAPARRVPFTAGYGFLAPMISLGIRRTVSSRGLPGYLLFNWLAG
jgi:hypothetical protein